MTDDIQKTIVNQTRAGAKPKEIISTLRLDCDEEDPITEAMRCLQYQSQSQERNAWNPDTHTSLTTSAGYTRGMVHASRKACGNTETWVSVLCQEVISTDAGAKMRGIDP